MKRKKKLHSRQEIKIKSSASLNRKFSKPRHIFTCGRIAYLNFKVFLPYQHKMIIQFLSFIDKVSMNLHLVTKKLERSDIFIECSLSVPICKKK